MFIIIINYSSNGYSLIQYNMCIVRLTSGRDTSSSSLTVLARSRSLTFAESSRSKKKEPRCPACPKSTEAGSGSSTIGDTVDIQSFTNGHITAGLFDARCIVRAKKARRTPEWKRKRKRARAAGDKAFEDSRKVNVELTPASCPTEFEFNE